MIKKVISIIIVLFVALASYSPFVHAVDIKVSAKSAVLMDADSGKVIYAKNENEKLPMASTTKIMTALITLEKASLANKTVTITDQMVKVEGSSMGLRSGYKLTLKDLAIGMLTVSGNDAANSAGTNYGPTNQKLIDRVKGDTDRVQAENPGAPVPVELVTTSASGLDPELSPAGAEFQVPRIARERGLSEDQVRAIIAKYSSPRQLGYLGEARVNVLEVNLALDEAKPMAK